MVFPQQQQQQQQQRQQHQQMVCAVVKNTFVDMIDEEELKKETGRPRAATCDGTLLRYTEGKPHMMKDNCEPLFTVTFGDSEPECEGSPNGTERTPGTPEPEPSIDSGYSPSGHPPSGQTQQNCPVGMALQQQPGALCDPSGCALPVFYAVCCTTQQGMMMQPWVPDTLQQFMFQQEQSKFDQQQWQQRQKQQQQHQHPQQRGFQQQQQQQQSQWPPQQSQWPPQQRTQHNQQQRQQPQQDKSVQQEWQQHNQDFPSPKSQQHQIPEHRRTTVMLRNIPNGYCADMLQEMLDRAGFASQYDFVYLPMDFRNHVNIGYAFVNMVDPAAARRLRGTFDGFNGWAIRSSKVCEVGWSHPQQGLAEHVERYRNSPMMHDSVPVEYRPRLFQNGIELPFPLPTKPIKPLKLRPPAHERFSESATPY